MAATPDPNAPQSETAETSGARPRWVRVNLRSLALLLIVIITGVIALLIFPGEGPVSPTSGIASIGIDGPFLPYGVSVTLTDEHHPDRTRVTVWINSQVPETARARLRMTVSVNAWGGPTRCDPRGGRCAVYGGSKFVTYYLGRWTTYQVGGTRYFHESIDTHLPEPNYNVVENNEYVAAALPNVSYFYYPPGRYNDTHPPPLTSRSVATWIALRVPQPRHYSWTSGIIPSVSGAFATWFYSNPIGTTEVATGVSLPVQDEDNKLLLLVGALLGVAGGALVGAIQEAVTAA
jgi:hypothetical protein